MKHIALALLNAQKKIKNAQKDAKNPHFRSDYATLESVIEAVKDIANEQGILIVQGTGADELGQHVNTTLIHSDSGESMSSKTYLILDKSNMQGLGSAITYARRYGAAAMFFIGQSDDDGNEASKRTIQAIQPSNSPGSYRIELAGKYYGKKLHEVPPKDLEAYIVHFEKTAAEKQQAVTGKTKLFIEMATAFLNQGED